MISRCSVVARQAGKFSSTRILVQLPAARSSLLPTTGASRSAIRCLASDAVETIEFQSQSAIDPTRFKDHPSEKLSQELSQEATVQNNSSNPVKESSLEISPAEDGNHGINPLTALNEELLFLVRTKQPHIAQDQYTRASRLFEAGQSRMRPSITSFNIVLKAWKHKPERALDFWQKEVDRLADKPDLFSYNTLLHSLAGAGMYSSAEDLFYQMLSPDSAVKPNILSYNTMLFAYQASEDWETTAPLSEVLLEKMLSLNTGENSAVPSPNVVSFATVIRTWAKHPDATLAVEKAEEWLQFFKSYPGTEPNVLLYEGLFKALARAAKAGNGVNAASSLQRVQELLDDLKASGLIPNTRIYTLVIHILLENRERDAAHEILRVMVAEAAATPSVRPNRVSFSLLLDAYGKSTQENPEKAVGACLEMHQQMTELGQIWQDTRPNMRTYTMILNILAWSKQRNAGTIAEKFIREMQEREVELSVIHYNCCINAYAQSNFDEKAVRVERVWDEMRARGIPEDITTYNNLLNTSANVNSRKFCKSALRLGAGAFRALQKDPNVVPSAMSYFNWFRTIGKQLDYSNPKRDELILQAFKFCCQQGLLNNRLLGYVLRYYECLQRLVQESLSHPVSDMRNISVSDLPTAWSKHST